MALPQPAVAIPHEIEHGTLVLRTKPNASIHYSFARSNHPPHHRPLVIFLNGLIADKASWLDVMAGVIRSRRNVGFPNMFSYDRYGQGLTEDRDPNDRSKEEGHHGHDVEDVVKDLHQIILVLTEEILEMPAENLHVLFVANSIGCAIARLYAQIYPGTITALLLLDSIMANSNFDFWPDPDSEKFREDELPEDVSVEVLKEQRAKFKALFGLDVKNKEGLDRRNLAKLLPQADGPKLIGPDGKGPWITVVGHDFETFAQESLKSMGTPLSLSMQYSNPIWHAYNQELVKITHKERRRGPLFAKGCGHFIQRDDPKFVVEELLALLHKVEIADN